MAHLQVLLGILFDQHFKRHTHILEFFEGVVVYLNQTFRHLETGNVGKDLVVDFLIHLFWNLHLDKLLLLNFQNFVFILLANPLPNTDLHLQIVYLVESLL